MGHVDMGALASQVLWAAFAVAVAFGAIALAAIIVGALSALRYQVWRLDRAA
jgi:hypothetical protein